MNKSLKKIASLAVVGALVTGGLAFSAQAASADQLTNGTITITPATGNRADANFLNSIDVTTGCPVGYRSSSDTQIYQGTTRMGSVSLTRYSDSPYGSWGFTGNAIHGDRTIAPTNGYLSAKNLDTTTQGQVLNGTVGNDANFELRVYCYADNLNRNYTTDKYFSLAMSINSTGDWKVGAAAVAPATATTTSLTALLNSDNTTTLTATVKDPNGAALPAGVTGSVQFLEGTTVAGTGTITNGVATANTTVLAAGSHTFTAQFTPGNAAVYAASTSGSASVAVAQPAAAPGSTNVTTTVPSGTGSLTFSGLQSAISLGTAVLAGGLFTANGNLGPITVTDTRQLGSTTWNLTGTSTDFKDGSKLIDGKYFGWTPSLVGSGNAGTAGAAVLPAPASTSGLKAASVLTTGAVVDGTTTTVVGAALSLAAPGNTRGGFYTAVLTLTLL
ncbi:MAG: Ig-like domain repeat protein [Candidatus Saccharibacteria bacterium]|nr:Ig-like domain repeat protein [Microbacteriaceae bacterium]